MVLLFVCSVFFFYIGKGSFRNHFLLKNVVKVAFLCTDGTLFPPVALEWVTF